MSVFPYRTWRRINREILNSDRKELFSLGEPQGDLNLRETIAQYLFAARGVLCQPDQIILGAGNDYLLVLLQLLLEKHHIFAFENPTYTKAYPLSWKANSCITEHGSRRKSDLQWNFFKSDSTGYSCKLYGIAGKFIKRV